MSKKICNFARKIRAINSLLQTLLYGVEELVKKNTIKYRRLFAIRKFKQHLKSKARESKVYVPFLPIQKGQGNNKDSKQGFRRPTRLSCPRIFSLEHNLTGVINFLSEVRAAYRKRFDKVSLDMSQVVDIDVRAIILLLSNMDYLSRRGVFVCGNYPNDPIVSAKLRESGFLSLVNSVNTEDQSSVNSDNGLIVNLGRNVFSGNEISIVNTHALEQVHREELSKKLYGIVGEMGGNAIQYAYSDARHYLYGYSYCADKHCVSFVFADAGFGILKTLRKTLGNHFEELINSRSKVEVLQGAFQKKYQSKTGDENRGLGLPYIRQAFESGLVSNLCVLTNDVLLDFAHPNNCKKLLHNYNGTVYLWNIYEKI